MQGFTDTHAHLYADHFNEDREAMIQRAIEAGVEYIFMPNIDKASSEGMYKIADQYPKNCFPMMGVHPCHIKEDFEAELAFAKNELYNSGRTFYAVGEIGLDFYWDLNFKEQQEEALKQQIAWAKERSLPIVLHCRESIDETLDIVESLNDENLKGIFHCFSGNLVQAERVKSLGGFFMGVGGVLTYKNSGMQDVFKDIDLNLLVLETDAPYLTPEPYRSMKKKKKEKRHNESAYLIGVAEKLAEIKNIKLEEVSEKTTANAGKLFKVNLS